MYTNNSKIVQVIKDLKKERHKIYFGFTNRPYPPFKCFIRVINKVENNFHSFFGVERGTLHQDVSSRFEGLYIVHGWSASMLYILYLTVCTIISLIIFVWFSSNCHKSSLWYLFSGLLFQAINKYIQAFLFCVWKEEFSLPEL